MGRALGEAWRGRERLSDPGEERDRGKGDKKRGC